MGWPRSPSDVAGLVDVACSGVHSGDDTSRFPRALRLSGWRLVPFLKRTGRDWCVTAPPQASMGQGVAFTRAEIGRWAAERRW
jgi:hypothetical protein